MFKKLSIKGRKFEKHAVQQKKKDFCNDVLSSKFDRNILLLSLCIGFKKSKYPEYPGLIMSIDLTLPSMIVLGMTTWMWRNFMSKSQ